MFAQLLPSTLLRPLKHRRFRALWAANIISNMGALMQTVAAAWLMASLAGTASMVALVQSASSLPGMALALLAGAAADQMDRRHLLLAAQILMLIASALLAWMTWAHHIGPWSLLLLTLMIGVGTALHVPAWLSSIRQHVPIEDLPQAISLNAIGFNVARILGPAIGGALMMVAGPSANFLVNCLSYMVMIAVLYQWRGGSERASDAPPVSAQSLLHAMREGMRYVWRDRLLRHAMLRVAFFCFASAALWALMPLIARDALKGSQLSYGALLGAFGVGSIVGALLMNSARHHMSVQMILALSALAYGVASALSISGLGFNWVLGLMILGGMGWVLTLATISVTMQMETDPAFLARSIAINNMGAFGGLALGSYLWGIVADAIGLHATMVASGLCVAATLFLALILPLPANAGKVQLAD